MSVKEKGKLRLCDHERTVAYWALKKKTRNEKLQDRMGNLCFIWFQQIMYSGTNTTSLSSLLLTILWEENERRKETRLPLG